MNVCSFAVMCSLVLYDIRFCSLSIISFRYMLLCYRNRNFNSIHLIWSIDNAMLKLLSFQHFNHLCHNIKIPFFVFLSVVAGLLYEIRYRVDYYHSLFLRFAKSVHFIKPFPNCLFMHFTSTKLKFNELNDEQIVSLYIRMAIV